MIFAEDAIRTARGYLGAPYSETDCIRLIVRVIRNSPGGDKSYRCQGTNWLWRSIENSGKYRDLTWRGDVASDIPRAGMLAFKRSGEDVHHVGLVTDGGTVIHSSSVHGKVVETRLDTSWDLLAIHRNIRPMDFEAGNEEMEEEAQMQAYRMRVAADSLNVRNEPGRGGERIGRLYQGALVWVQAELDNGWKYITYGDNGVGYVDGTFLEAYDEPKAPEQPSITIVDSEGNRFEPVGDFRVLIGGID